MTEITTLNDFIQWVESINPDLEPEKYLFRGLPNKDYAVEASAWRRLPDEHDRSSLEEFLEVNKDLINKARAQGHGNRYGRRLTDLEILAELQHFRAATCLIDFTYSAQIALWFACEPLPEEKPGKVVAVLNDPNTVEEITPQTLEEDRDIDSFFNKENPNKMWQPQLYRWQPYQLSNRITHQHSVFLFGGTQVIFPDENCICVIVEEKKQEVLKSLEQFSHITGDVLFPDFEGFALEHRHDKPYRFPDYYKLGDQAYQRNQDDDAILYYTTAIRMNPKNDDAYASRGLAKLRKSLSGENLYEESIEDLDSAINLNNRKSFFYTVRGLVYKFWGNTIKAENDFRNALQLAQQANDTFAIRRLEKELHNLNNTTAD